MSWRLLYFSDTLALNESRILSMQWQQFLNASASLPPIFIGLSSIRRSCLKIVEENPNPKAVSKPIERKRKLLDFDEDSEGDERKKVSKKFKGKMIRF
ncbi:hypothetical protein CTI12_AA599790 [Artemisia annua]|uniref:Uncharacterized protein n=1 Tax=Artemisia annua TaxID=35608 RepID=A0A2U1KI49_ARTAN|nr:hypothetical protein CTI12_AA599790 [Artemisia annua]